MKKIFFSFVCVLIFLFVSCGSVIDPNKPFNQYKISNKSDFTILVGGETVSPGNSKTVTSLDSNFENGFIKQTISYDGNDYTIKPMKYSTTSGLCGNITGVYTCFITVENASNFAYKSKYNYTIKNNTDFDITVKIYPYGSSTPVEKQVDKKNSGIASSITLEEVKYLKPTIKLFASNEEIKTQATEVGSSFLSFSELAIANKENSFLITVNSL